MMMVPFLRSRPSSSSCMVIPVVQGLLLIMVGPAVVRGLISVGTGGSDRRVGSRPSTTTATARWMTTSHSKTRISIAEAIARAGELTFIDASWYHKGDRNGHDEYLRGPRIAKSVYFDLSNNNSYNNNSGDDDHKADNNNKKNGGQPTATQFAHTMDRLGITNEAQIVVYGQKGAFFTPRVWFTIRHLMGHEQCHLLDGTLADWMAANGPLEYHTLHHQQYKHSPENESSNYRPKYNPHVLITLPEMKQFVAARRGILWDARGSSFQTQGHIPGAVHVPYSSLHDADGRLLSTEQIAARLSSLQGAAAADDDDDTSTNDNDVVVVTCGSGVSACTLFWAWHELGWDQTRRRVRVYDGSWSEWKRQNDVPKIMPAAVAPPTAASSS